MFTSHLFFFIQSEWESETWTDGIEWSTFGIEIKIKWEAKGKFGEMKMRMAKWGKQGNEEKKGNQFSWLKFMGKARKIKWTSCCYFFIVVVFQCWLRS